MRESLKKYLEYADSEAEFIYRVRMDREWDDVAYQSSIELVMSVINDYKFRGVIPIPVVLFFTTGLNNLVDMISHPDFHLNISATCSDLIASRKKELLTLQGKFFSGELFYLE
jgi:hypothetical protein